MVPSARAQDFFVNNPGTYLYMQFSFNGMGVRHFARLV